MHEACLQRMAALCHAQKNLTCVMDVHYLNYSGDVIDSFARLYLPVGLWPSIALGLFFRAFAAVRHATKVVCASQPRHGLLLFGTVWTIRRRPVWGNCRICIFHLQPVRAAFREQRAPPLFHFAPLAYGRAQLRSPGRGDCCTLRERVD